MSTLTAENVNQQNHTTSNPTPDSQGVPRNPETVGAATPETLAAQGVSTSNPNGLAPSHAPTEGAAQEAPATRILSGDDVVERINAFWQSGNAPELKREALQHAKEHIESLLKAEPQPDESFADRTRAEVRAQAADVL